MSILIKVKYGETLRRLNVTVSECKLVLDMVMLKEKIRSFFNFGSSDEFTMTYIDEDGDTVTLADDDDLHDIVGQLLNPLRITVNLNRSNSKEPSGDSTSVKSQQNQHPLQTLNHVCEPVLESFAKLILDLDSKLSFSHPVVVELVKMLKDAYSDKIMDRMTVLPAIGDLSNVNPEAGKKKERQVQKVSEGVELKDVQPTGGVDHNNPHFECESFQSPVGSTKSGGEGSADKDKITTESVEKEKDSSSEKKDDIGECINEPTKLNQSGQFAHVGSDMNNSTNVSGSAADSSQGMLNADNQCSFSGIPVTNDTDSQGHHHHHHHSHSSHLKIDNLDNNGTGHIMHRSVRCDGCGVHPIIGSRFKSKVKDDYDLCGPCFMVMGNSTDYIRIDRPISNHRLYIPPFKGFYDHPPHSMWAPGSNPSWSTLDSRFIQDVNVLDGTVMAPSTAFTKIWRMRNNGSIIWPYGSQLQWVGGDRLSSSDSVDVEIPLDGLPVGKELDIAADFTAPELPGQYVSYWRMASPSGQKFGQRVWVLIQVDASMGEPSINLNLPPVTNDEDHLADNTGLSNTMATHSTPPGTASGGGMISDDQESALVEDLEAMRFKQDWNKEFSRMNDYDMDTTVDLRDDLEWDRMLDELQEMGFTDDEANKRLLKKNDGSIKRVVMDLINEENA